jgi:hypothetical protein
MELLIIMISRSKVDFTLVVLDHFIILESVGVYCPISCRIFEIEALLLAQLSLVLRCLGSERPDYSWRNPISK